ncbi:hypothetical protein HGA13_13955 [Nocardia speluncae]|uniref:Uncharacterized protein n=1 Tax=Nocardia speluncae TaxID=419477 RepID=A0A846XHN1_9NOCA|nr:hypothetical protein [Nocardia speluncae]NKY34176.1 hypothetical protein [Nocardia speluncae]
MEDREALAAAGLDRREGSDMDDLTSTAVRWGDWLVLVDPRWQETAPEVTPPSEVLLGGWMVGKDGVAGLFEPNPHYVALGR